MFIGGLNPLSFPQIGVIYYRHEMMWLNAAGAKQSAFSPWYRFDSRYSSPMVDILLNTGWKWDQYDLGGWAFPVSSNGKRFVRTWYLDPRDGYTQQHYRFPSNAVGCRFDYYQGVSFLYS